jgi:hypothetical protein
MQASAEIWHGSLLIGNRVWNWAPISGDHSIISRERAALRRLVRQINEGFVYIAPAPAFWWVIAFHDRVVGFVKMFGCVAALRLITAANVTAFSESRK